jgi:UDP-N-acetylglucosamine--N-acetylmuramyl-(pentapeptide) pyrophosphoryl-undecaprenol N-acetylglucosamine transferase
MFLDKDWNGERMFQVVSELIGNRGQLAAMGEAARKLARPGAAARAAEVLLEVACGRAN